MKVSTENDNNFGYETITIVVDNIPSRANNSQSIKYYLYKRYHKGFIFYYWQRY